MYLTENTELGVAETTVYICLTIANPENGGISSDGRGRVNQAASDMFTLSKLP